MEVSQSESAPPSGSIERAHVPLSVFVDGIKQIASGLVTKTVVGEYLARFHVVSADLDPFKKWSPDHYTRNLIYRDPMVEIMLICWNIGDVTPLHTHNGQLGWMTMIEGRLMVENYRVRNCSSPENQQVVGIDCLAGATWIDMEKLHSELVVPGGALNTVDKTQTTHRILNPAEWNEPAVSMHIYSRPIDSCVVFDPEGNRCYRRDLKFDS